MLLGFQIGTILTDINYQVRYIYSPTCAHTCDMTGPPQILGRLKAVVLPVLHLLQPCTVIQKTWSLAIMYTGLKLHNCLDK